MNRNASAQPLCCRFSAAAGLWLLLCWSAASAETGSAEPVAISSGWKMAMLVFVIGMVLSVFHSIKLLRSSSKPGPGYWMKRFEQACSKHDPRGAESALLFWGKTMYGVKAPSSLEGLATHMQSGAAREQVRLLQDICRSGETDWNAYLCSQVLSQELRDQMRTHSTAD